MTLRILKLTYPDESALISAPQDTTLLLALAGLGREVGVRGRVTAPALLRDAWLTAAAVRESDLRHRARDRSAYLAHLAAHGKRASKAVWEAQKQYLDQAYDGATPRGRGLDPVLTVDPDEVSLEVFSRDESAYARLALDNALLSDRAASHGSSYADLSPALVEQLLRLRAYQPLTLDATSRATGAEPRPVRELELPESWLRGFLQVQSAATLPSVRVDLAPIDLYNVLYALRIRRAKRAPRALRFELVPGLRPRIVLEPWETVLECHAAPYAGSAPRVIRAYGRARLGLLARLLPHVRAARVHLVGPGLPSFWVLDLGLARLTLALTSWAESSWASTASFDVLLPRASDVTEAARAEALLVKRGPLALPAIAKKLKLDPSAARAALAAACLRGQVLFDLDRGVYRPRALLSEPVELESIRFGSEREAVAHRLLHDPDTRIEITKVHTLVGEGQEVHGRLELSHAARTFVPRFTLDLEGQVRDAFCSCTHFQQTSLREGPCEHLIALYLRHQRSVDEAARMRETPAGRALVRAETRTLVRRDASGVQTRYRISLDDRVVRVEKQELAPGRPTEDPRATRVWYDTDTEARAAYYARLDTLGESGFVELEAV